MTSNIEYELEENYISDYYNSYVVGTRIIYSTDTNEDFTITTTMEFDQWKSYYFTNIF